MNELNVLFFQSLGNHEFDEAVIGVVPFIENLNTPVLAANLILDKVPELQNQTNLYKSIIITKNDVKIGIIGYLTPKTKQLAPKNDVEYEDEVIAIRREVDKLKKHGVKIFIALGHSGYLKDLEIALDVEDIDLVIGGHSNTFLWNGNATDEKPEEPEGPYPVDVMQPSGRIARVVQAYAYTKYLGKLHLIFDSNGEIIEYDGQPILLNHDIERDPELLKTVNRYRYNIEKNNNVIIGRSSVLLDKEQCRLRECNLGDLIADAILNFTKHNYNPSNASIAIIQGGRIRASIDNENKPFNMTKGDWLTVIPFTDPLTIVTMKGNILMQSLEHSVESWRTIDTPGQFLQFSGLEVVYDLNKPPGFRVVKAKAICSICGHNEMTDIKDDYKYNVIMSTFLADGGDEFSMFEGLPKEILSYNEIDCVEHYLDICGMVDQKVDKRITLLNEGKLNKITVIEYQKNILDVIKSSSSSIINVKHSIYFNILQLIVCYWNIS